MRLSVSRMNNTNCSTMGRYRITIVLLVLLVVVAGFFLWLSSQRRAEYDSLKLWAVALAMAEYANQHDGKLPQSLEALEESHLIQWISPDHFSVVAPPLSDFPSIPSAMEIAKEEISITGREGTRQGLPLLQWRGSSRRDIRLHEETINMRLLEIVHNRHPTSRTTHE